MTIAAEDVDLQRLALELAVDQLTMPEQSRIERETDEGPRVESATAPCLIEQVEQSVEDNSGPAGSAVARSKPPLRIDAVDLLAEIDVEVRGYGRRGRNGRVARLRAWSAGAHSVVDRDAFAAYVEQAEGWVRRARALLNPLPPWLLRGMPCPQCGATAVETTDGTGEVVLRPPLEVDRYAGVARCVAADCGLRVAPDGWEHLADQIARQTAVEHLQHEEDA